MRKAKPVVQQLMMMLTRASVVRSLLMMKALVWMTAARDWGGEGSDQRESL